MLIYMFYSLYNYTNISKYVKGDIAEVMRLHKEEGVSLATAEKVSYL
jgi:hypothetical protein